MLQPECFKSQEAGSGYGLFGRFQCSLLVAEGSRVLCRSKISFACKDQEIKDALEPHVDESLLYASLGGTKPDDSYSFDRLDTLMRSLDKVGPIATLDFGITGPPHVFS